MGSTWDLGQYTTYPAQQFREDMLFVIERNGKREA
jgi:hypothetical protein